LKETPQPEKNLEEFFISKPKTDSYVVNSLQYVRHRCGRFRGIEGILKHDFVIGWNHCCVWLVSIRHDAVRRQAICNVNIDRHCLSGSFCPLPKPNDRSSFGQHNKNRVTDDIGSSLSKGSALCRHFKLFLKKDHPIHFSKLEPVHSI